MKTGDLVKPLASCSGEPGQLRCEIAIITNYDTPGKPTIVCKCGSSKQYESQLEVINESR